ncbi:MAG: hypothetical protein HY895_03080 [Deltaproteobacteria bacterium]|nr:hypothetical protein [Deltaproteobacteria bacterium]
MSPSNRRSILSPFILIALLLTASAASAYVVTAGPGDFEGTHSSHTYNPLLSGWWVGPAEVEMDPEAGFWTKELRLPRWAGLESPLNLVEILRVGSGVSWNGWNERFLSAGWDWSRGSAYVFGPDGLKQGKPPLGGLGSLFVAGDISEDGNAINFTFQNALSPGNWLVIWEQFTWTGENTGGRPRSILLAQSPVPIPGALWLLSSGILGMLLIRRRLTQ